MKTRTKVVTGIITIMLSCVLLFTTIMISNNTNNFNQVSANSRTIELSQSALDVQSVFDEFEDATLTREGSTVYFEGFKSLDSSAISEIDYISEVDIEELENCITKYNFSYNSETNIVTIAATIQLQDGTIEVEELRGVGFINENNEIDAVMNIEGESVLLSEMRDAGLIENCGWFSKLISSVVKAVVIVAVAAVVVTAAVAVSVATAGAASAALVAVGVGLSSTAITATSATVGLAAGLLFTSTIGKAAIQAGTAYAQSIGDDIEYVVDKATEKIKAFWVKGAEYIAKIVTTQIIKELPKNLYYLAAVNKDDSVSISVDPINYTLAVWATRFNQPIYTYYRSNAYNVASDAGDGLFPIYDPAHTLDENGNKKHGIFFDHFHTYKHMGHCFFDTPIIQ